MPSITVTAPRARAPSFTCSVGRIRTATSANTYCYCCQKVVGHREVEKRPRSHGWMWQTLALKLNTGAVRPQSPGGFVTRAWLLCHSGSSERSLPCQGSPRAVSPWLNWGPEGQGLRPEAHSPVVGSQPPRGQGHVFPPGPLEPTGPGRGSEPQAGEGPTAADPGSPDCEAWRLPEATGPASCAAGFPRTLGPGSDLPHLGPSSQAGSRGACREQPAGRGPHAGNGLSARSGRGPPPRRGGPDFRLGSLSPHPTPRRPFRLPTCPSVPHLPAPTRGTRPRALCGPCGEQSCLWLGARSCRVNPALLDTGHGILETSRTTRPPAPASRPGTVGVFHLQGWPQSRGPGCWKSCV